MTTREQNTDYAIIKNFHVLCKHVEVAGHFPCLNP